MPGTPTTKLQLPRASLADPANIEAAVNPLSDKLEATMGMALINRVEITDQSLGPVALSFSAIPAGFRALRVLGSVGSYRTVAGDGFCGLGLWVNGLAVSARYMEHRLTWAAATPPSQLLTQGTSIVRAFIGQTWANNNANGQLDLLLDLTNVNYAATGVIPYQSLANVMDPDASLFSSAVSRVNGMIDASGPVTSLQVKDDTGAVLAEGTDLALYGIN